ncbi:MAG: AMP-binding protein [Rothia sp. (in: high G+C Gram-positive bacteria)]|nr:AMP-binding protein [Rothia sp. (in: high G+C Gram-positive bacteria)]
MPQPQELALTTSQAGILSAQLLEPDSYQLLVGDLLYIPQQLAEQTLYQALEKTLAQNPYLSYRLAQGPGGQASLVPGQSPHIVRHNLASSPTALEQAQALALEDTQRPINLTSDCLIRIKLFNLGAAGCALSLVTHHILIDGYGITLLLKAFLGHLKAALDPSQTGPEPWAEPSELLQAEAAYLSSEQFQLDHNFWAGQEPAETVVTGFSPQSRQTRIQQKTSLQAKLPFSLRELSLAAAQEQLGPADLLLAAYGLVLAKNTCASEVAIGLPMMNRQDSLAARTLSSTVNVLPLHLSIDPAMSVSDYLHSVASRLSDIKKHSRYPAEKLLTLHGHHARGSQPFATELNIKMFNQLPRVAGCQPEIINLNQGPIKDLNFLATLGKESSWKATYPTGLNQTYVAERIRDLNTALLELTNPAHGTRRLGRIKLRPAAEQAHSKHRTQARQAPETKKLLGQLLAESCRQHSQQPALSIKKPNGQLETLSYGQLAQRIQSIQNLLEKHSQAGQALILDLERSIDALCWLLASISCGRIAVPLDDKWPLARKNSIRDHLNRSLPLTPITINQDQIRSWTDQQDQQDSSPAEPVKISQDAPAYIIHTSGSTGQPKPVLVSQASLANHLHNHWLSLWQHQKPAKALLSAPLTFDASWDALGSLLWGWQLYLISEEDLRDPHTACQYIGQYGINSIHSTPTVVQSLVNEGLLDGDQELALIEVGGEACSSELWNSISQGQLASHNFYGPTETTVNALGLSKKELTSQQEQEINQYLSYWGGSPIGWPLAGFDAHVLDPTLQPVAEGSLGELYLSGPQLALGYLGLPAKTAERFLACPWGKAGQRMYRTGDLVRKLPRGGLLYVGRADQQVKVRGYRIEPGEIVAALEANPHISQAVVKAEADRLIAWVISQYPAQQLREELAQELPAHLLPHLLIPLENFPYTAHGKVALDQLEIPQLSSQTEPPQTQEEKVLAQVFERVLKVKNPSIQDDFFVLGGDSILAIRVVAELANLGWQSSVTSIFNDRRLKDIARSMQAKVHTQAATASSLVQDEQQVAAVRQLLARRHRPGKG